MSANIKLNNIIASAIKGGLSKLLNTALSWTLSNKGYSDDNLESLDKVPLTDEPTRLVDSFCADFNGSSSYISVSPITFDYSSNWTLCFSWKADGVANEKVLFGSSVSGTYYFVRLSAAANAIEFFEGTTLQTCSFGANTFVNGEIYDVEVSYSTTTGKITSSVTGGFTASADTADVRTGWGATWSLSFDIIGKRGNNDRYMDGLVYNLYGDDFNYPLQGSTYDVSGSGNHGTPTNITYDRQDFFNYNIKYGCDIYLDDATSTDYIYVPYVDDSPVVTSISGYTKQSSNPSGFWHNGSETKFIVGATTYDTGDEAWNVDALVQAADVDHILHSATTAYGIPIAYGDLVAEQGNYLYFNVQEDYEHKDLILFSSPYPAGMQAVAVHKYVKNGDNLAVDIDGEYIFDLNNYPIWSDE